MQQKFNVNPQRIFLAGMGAGGTTALEVILEKPELFAGAASLCGEFPTVDKPLARFRGLRGRRLLLSTTYTCPDVKVLDLVNSGRMLYAAGMQVGTRVYQQSGDAATAKMLRDIDHWIMGSIQTALHA
jgi:predicted esterase